MNVSWSATDEDSSRPKSVMLEGLDPTPLHVPYRVQYNIETGAKKALLLSLDIYHFFLNHI